MNNMLYSVAGWMSSTARMTILLDGYIGANQRLCGLYLGENNVSYRMYALCITLCVTAGGNAFPQPQRRLRIWYYDLVLEDFISLIDVFSDVFRKGYSQSSS